MSAFRVQQVACLSPSKSMATPASTWLPGMPFAPSLGHTEGEEHCVCFFLKITGGRRVPLAETWDPHQVSMKEIASETKDKCFALFRVSEKFPWCGGAAEVGSDNYSSDTHTLWKEQCFHYTLQSVSLHLVSLEPRHKLVRRAGRV